ncbi:MAG: hypothetical protein COY58_09420 [Gammaproteobacteria bacterium CG_4_10_14_0_8_um_filter_38_16]|nr:MAG: hypothetical protein COY58_09420 [Gammaproteobacteria bacterium CG_4_10_14_0_8_um_filter_38_16]PJA03091.1 MAG: hypothetical protein COX72_07245 [Gammaproteobacteria bacterium CG_4_10_14_0_2_um_filter_38_22]PJB10289.1 MAG: hypothetical protein CO120_05660 [Gammaproteobacteria bacterium CG_4_9_14_3_um_filter_38_9]
MRSHQENKKWKVTDTRAVARKKTHRSDINFSEQKKQIKQDRKNKIHSLNMEAYETTKATRQDHKIMLLILCCFSLNFYLDQLTQNRSQQYKIKLKPALEALLAKIHNRYQTLLDADDDPYTALLQGPKKEEVEPLVITRLGFFLHKKDNYWSKELCKKGMIPQYR